MFIGSLDEMNLRSENASLAELRILPAVTRDVDLVVKISAEAYTKIYNDVIGAVPKPAYENYAPRIARSEVYLGYIGSEACCVLVLENQHPTLLIYSVAVCPRWQGCGFATQLLNFACRFAFDNGFAAAALYTNIKMLANIRLYERCGFIPQGSRPHPTRADEMLLDMLRKI